MKKIYLVFCLMLLSISAQAMTRLELENEVRRLVKDTNTDTTKQTWSSTTITDRINMAQYDMVAKTRCLQNFSYIDTVNNQEGYILPSDLLTINRVGYTVATSSYTNITSTSAFKKIDRATILGLDNALDYWEQQAPGKPTQYYILGSSICLVPRPSTSYAGSDRIKITYVTKPDTISNDSDVPLKGYNFLYPYHEILTYYVAMKCFLDRGDTNTATYYQNMYFASLQLMITQLNSPADWNPDVKFQGIMSNK